ncbi:hypothetical protein KP509_11G058300 [Ceratopteris richardii]|uniref:RING-CH-type domain-containing protein n=1 Tax=Ceratopteris richardii TaxID=49495 RepID=A0A8T2TV68_CERRI|nr:hypothetical protein KP509_11G058300 [Ceratopteris richardii]
MGADTVCPSTSPYCPSSMSDSISSNAVVIDIDPSIPECRICQEEEDASKLDVPCACSGSLKYAHRTCIQRWCTEKGDIICEICLQPYKHGYTVSSSRPRPGNVSINISDDWDTSNARSAVFRDPQFLALAMAQRQILDADYEYTAEGSRSTACCLALAIILVILLLLRYTIMMVMSSGDNNDSMFLIVFVLRMIGFFLPCYIMVQSANTLQREQRQAALLRAAEVSFLQSWQTDAIRIALDPSLDLHE